MGIGVLQPTNSRTNYAGYAATGNKKVDNFYAGLSSAVEKSESEAAGDFLGLTMIPYGNDMSYGMAAFYSSDSKESEPIIRLSSNYGGEQRFYDVHVNAVNPRSASQLEMFALSCYLDDKGITDGKTFGSFSRMKTYASNAYLIGEEMIDFQDPANASVKIDWIGMLKKMKEIYLQCHQTYLQYLDCNALASKLEDWSQTRNLA